MTRLVDDDEVVAVCVAVVLWVNALTNALMASLVDCAAALLELLDVVVGIIVTVTVTS